MAYAVVNKSGCVERKGSCQIRLDFFLDAGEPRYDDCHGGPFHSHFVYFDADFTEEDIKAAIEVHMPNFYKAFQEGSDKIQGGMRRGWLTETRIRPTDCTKNQARVQQCQAALNKLTAFSYKPEADREGKLSPATEIDIGADATDRGLYWGPSYTLVCGTNPANATGIIDTFELWANTDMSGTNKVGTFSGAAPNFTNRDGATIGTVTAGAKRTFTGLSIDVSTGDYAGVYSTIGRLEADTAGVWVYYSTTDNFGAGVKTYTLSTTKTISLYGTGEAPESTAASKTAHMGATLIGHRMI